MPPVRFICALLAALFHAHAIAASSSYVIQPGDVLELHVVGVPELAHRVTVSPEGTAAFPLITDIVAAGRSLDDVRAELRTTLSQVIVPRPSGTGADDAVAFTASQIGLAIAEYRPIYVSGDVSNPGAHPYRIGMTAREALAVAGGIAMLQPESALPAQAEYASVMGELAREQMRLMVLRAEDAGETPLGLVKSTDAAAVGGDPEFLKLEAQRLEGRQDALAAEKAFLGEAIEGVQRRLEVLHERREREASSLAEDEADLDRVKELFGQGLSVAERIADARRNVLSSATRLLQTESTIAVSENEIMELRRRIVRLDETRREGLLDELREAEASVQALQTRMLFAAQQVALTGMAADGRRGYEAARLTIHRRSDGGVVAFEASLDAELAPGDVIEATMPSPLGP